MSIVIASGILLLIASSYAVLLKRKLAETVFPAVVTIVFVLYCFGLLNFSGCLLYGICFLTTFAIIGFGYLIYCFIKDRNRIKEAELTQGLLLYMVLLFLSVSANYGKMYHLWDEFVHWGAYVKYSYSVDALVTYKAGYPGLVSPQYFQATSIFQYFFTRFSSGFVEWYSYIAMNIMAFSLVMPLVKNIFKKGYRIKNTALLAVFVLIPLQYRGFICDLSVDYILGLFFGFMLLYYFAYENDSQKFRVIIVSAAAFMLVNTKDIGLLLLTGALIIMVIDILFFSQGQLKETIYKKSILILAPIAVTVFIRMTWSNLLSRSNISGHWQIPTISNILSLFDGQIQPYQAETIRSFANEALTGRVNPYPFSYFWFCVIFLLIAIVITVLKKMQFARMVTSATVLAIGAGMYQLVLLILYLFTFDPYESVRLASYERYSFTYMLGMMIFLMIYFVNDAEFKISNMIPHGIVCIALIACLCSFAAPGVLGIAYESLRGISPGNTNRFYERDTSAIIKWMPKFNGVNPYLILPRDNGYYLGRLSFEMYPDYVAANSYNDFAIGREKFPQPDIEDDVYTMIVTPGEWGEHVLSRGYSLAYVFNLSPEFEDTYGHLFLGGVRNDMLYNIVHDNGNMSFIPVE